MRIESGAAPDEAGAQVESTHGDVGSVTVQVLIRVLRNGLAPLGPALELDVVDIDSAGGGEHTIWGGESRRNGSAPLAHSAAGSGRADSRINNVGIDALATLRVVVVAVEGAESERLAVREPSESLQAIRRVSE